MGDVAEARILNRVIRITPSGWEYEADQRHVDLIITEMGAERKKTIRSSTSELKRHGLEELQPEPIISLLIGLTWAMPLKRSVEEWQHPRREIGGSYKDRREI